ncbi:MAG: hypothetical protein R3B09_32345 [Nannocystaceae bacterium]
MRRLVPPLVVILAFLGGLLLAVALGCAVGDGYCDDATATLGPLCLGDPGYPCDEDTQCYSGQCVDNVCTTPTP